MTEGAFDVVIVLGARPGAALVRRARYGSELLRRGRAARLLAVGGNGRPQAEADLIAAEAVRSGVLESAILREPRSRDTGENALHAAALLRAHGLRRALLVTDWPHMARALACFRLVGVSCRAAPVPGSGGRPLYWIKEGCACGLYLRHLPRLLRARQTSPDAAA